MVLQIPLDKSDEVLDFEILPAEKRLKVRQVATLALALDKSVLRERRAVL